MNNIHLNLGYTQLGWGGPSNSPHPPTHPPTARGCNSSLALQCMLTCAMMVNDGHASQRSEPCWSKGRAKAGGQSINYPSDIENALPLLDEAGEWYGDWKNGVVYYAPLPGQTPETVKVLLGSSIGSSNSGNDNTASENSSNDSSNDSKHSTPAHSSVAAISIMAGATRVRVEHITFTHLTWLEPSTNSGYVDLQSGYASAALVTPPLGFGYLEDANLVRQPFLDGGRRTLPVSSQERKLPHA